VQVIATGRLFRAGILLKSGSTLERLAQVDTIAFDKTGTLTEPSLALVADPSWTEADLEEAAAIAVVSRHPLARALVAVTSNPKPADNVTEVAGSGLLRATPQGEIRLGSRAFCGIVIGPVASGPELWLRRPGRPPLRFAFAERPRQDAAAAIGRLKARGYALHLLSGDRMEPVNAVARAVSVDDRRSGLDPVAKTGVLQSLQASGSRVLMGGDGLNDAPALAAASVSMSPSTAADLSQTIADIVFQGR
jgi:Cu2+-exporting ATPase